MPVPTTAKSLVRGYACRVHPVELSGRALYVS